MKVYRKKQGYTICKNEAEEWYNTLINARNSINNISDEKLRKMERIKFIIGVSRLVKEDDLIAIMVDEANEIIIIYVFPIKREYNSDKIYDIKTSDDGKVYIEV